MPLYQKTAEQLGHTYRQMAEVARYRPAAPSDGCGNITVPLAELDLDSECLTYARRWVQEEDKRSFWVGCCCFPTRPATVYAIEAARNLCGAEPKVARRLLQMALDALGDEP